MKKIIYRGAKMIHRERNLPCPPLMWCSVPGILHPWVLQGVNPEVRRGRSKVRPPSPPLWSPKKIKTKQKLNTCWVNPEQATPPWPLNYGLWSFYWEWKLEEGGGDSAWWVKSHCLKSLFSQPPTCHSCTTRPLDGIASLASLSDS